MGNHSPQHTFKQYVLRKNAWRGQSINYTITMPQEVVDRFSPGTKFSIEVSGDIVILRSGLDILNLKNNNFQIEDL